MSSLGVRRPRHRVVRFAVLAVVTASLVAAGSASAATPYSSEAAKVTSFDGTQLQVYFYPAQGLQEGQTAPTILDGSAWSVPAMPSWLPDINAIGIDGISIDAALLGPATLTADGYNVVAWSARGWYASGGQVSLDNPYIEGRDVTAIINWLGTQPAAELKGPDDPVVGMTGVSYAGGIQLSTAVFDHRLDAIEPNMSWDNAVDSLYPNQVVKAGWGGILCGSAALVGARLSPIATDLCNSQNTGDVTPAEIAYGEEASPGSLVKNITAPTLLLAGTTDTLFPLNGDVATYDYLQQAGVPVKMMWYCGGHGICDWPTGTSSYVEDAELAWFDKYLKHESVDTGPGFEYLDQTGTWRSEPSYPVPAIGQVAGGGSGWLGISPTDSSGLIGIAATSASNALDFPIAPPSTSVDTLADPTVTLNYQGWATQTSTPVFAQLVDKSSGDVLDNQATAIRLTLDGATHTITFPLNMVVWNLTPSSDIELQLTDGSDLFYAQQSSGLLHINSAHVSIPVSPPGPPS